MHERTKEIDQLRRLAELLRQAWGATGEGGAPPTKDGPGVKKLRRTSTEQVIQAAPKR